MPACGRATAGKTRAVPDCSTNQSSADLSWSIPIIYFDAFTNGAPALQFTCTPTEPPANIWHWCWAINLHQPSKKSGASRSVGSNCYCYWITAVSRQYDRIAFQCSKFNWTYCSQPKMKSNVSSSYSRFLFTIRHYLPEHRHVENIMQTINVLSTKLN